MKYSEEHLAFIINVTECGITKKRSMKSCLPLLKTRNAEDARQNEQQTIFFLFFLPPKTNVENLQSNTVKFISISADDSFSLQQKNDSRKSRKINTVKFIYVFCFLLLLVFERKGIRRVVDR